MYICQILCIVMEVPERRQKLNSSVNSHRISDTGTVCPAEQITQCLMFRSNDTLQYYCFQTAAFFNRVAGLELEFWTCQVITDESLWLRKPKKLRGVALIRDSRRCLT